MTPAAWEDLGDDLGKTDTSVFGSEIDVAVAGVAVA
jgi:hypothetical protein